VFIFCDYHNTVNGSNGPFYTIEPLSLCEGVISVRIVLGYFDAGLVGRDGGVEADDEVQERMGDRESLNCAIL